MVWLGQKPCWLGERVNELSSGCKRRSKTLTAGQRREINPEYPDQVVYLELFLYNSTGGPSNTGGRGIPSQ